jgi:hypothetical protein
MVFREIVTRGESAGGPRHTVTICLTDGIPVNADW